MRRPEFNLQAGGTSYWPLEQFVSREADLYADWLDPPSNRRLVGPQRGVLVA